MKNKGISYFPMDTDFDRSMKRFRKIYGSKGVGLWLLIIMTIQKEDGYYTEIDLENNDSVEDLAFALDEVGGENFLKTILEYLIGKEVFSNEMYNRYKILTSKRLQKNYLFATKRRKTEINKKYLIVDNSEKSANNFKETVNNFNKSDIQVETKDIIVKNSILNNNILKPITTVDKPKKEKKKNVIPYQEILDYLNLKAGKRYRDTETNKKYIRPRWIKDKMRLDDFFKCIDNAYTFRMERDKGDMTYMKPSVLFNTKMEERINGDAYGWKDNKKPVGKNQIPGDIEPEEWFDEYMKKR